MHCSQVTELLSEYVDDALDPSIRMHVEEHLEHCHTCATELVSLRIYLEAIGSLPRVQAPAGFLTSVHERLEQPGLFKRLLTWLFFPMKVKLPFEAAGLVAASLLVVLLYRGAEPEKAQFSPVSPAPSLQTPAAPAAPAPTAPASPALVPSTPSRPPAEKSLEVSRPSAASRLAVEEAKKDEAPLVAAGSSSPAATAVRIEEPVKSAPAPLQQRAAPPDASHLTPHVQAPAALQERTKSLAREPLSAKPPAALSAAVPRPIELVLRLTPPADVQATQKDVLREQSPAGASSTTSAPQAQEQALSRKATLAPMRTTEKAETTAPVSPATTLARIKELVEQAKGSVLSVDHEQHTQSPLAVAAQVPARNYPAFLHELRHLGQLEEPTAKPRLPNEDTMIQLRIRLVPPG